MSEIEAALSRVEMTVEIVSAYVEHNSVPALDLPVLIMSVHAALGLLAGDKAEVPQEPLQPKVPIRKSVSTDHIVCLEDGRRFKSLKRHLQAEHGLSPDEYRAKWGLPKDYPMVAPAYADARSTLAKTIGLGRKAAAAEETEVPGDPVVAPESHAGHDHAAPDHAAPDRQGDAAGDVPAGKPGRRKVEAA